MLQNKSPIFATVSCQGQVVSCVVYHWTHFTSFFQVLLFPVKKSFLVKYFLLWVAQTSFSAIRQWPIAETIVSRAILAPLLITSVTRFGEISPLWRKFKDLWQFLRSYLGFGKMLKPTSTTNITVFGLIFIIVNGQN